MGWVSEHILETLGLIGAAIGAGWQSPPIRKVRRWAGAGHATEQHDIIREIVTEAIQPLTQTVNECRAQLFPNSGSSLNDRVGKMEELMVRRGDVLDTVVRDLDRAGTSLDELRAGQLTILERLFTHLPLQSQPQPSGGD